MAELDGLTILLLISAGKIKIDTELNIFIDDSLPAALTEALGQNISMGELTEIIGEFAKMSAEVVVEIGEEIN